MVLASPPSGQVAVAPRIAAARASLHRGRLHPLWAQPRDVRVAACRANIELFGRVYFPHRFTEVTPAFHHELFAIADTLHHKNLPGAVIAAPRQHAKTTILGFLVAMHRIVYDLERFIVIISNTLDQAVASTTSIRVELEENEQLQADFGNLAGDLSDKHRRRRWTDANLVTVTGIRVYARSTGSKIRGVHHFGKRPTLVIGDDLENEEHVQTPQQRKKLMDWWNGAVVNAVDKRTGRIIVIGTILHFDALLKHLLNEEQYLTRIYRTPQDDGTALWPELFPLPDLAALKKRIGSYLFNAEYRNNPVDEAQQVFKPAWWRWYTRDDLTYDHAARCWRFRGLPLTVYQGVDPAIDEKEESDQFSIVTVGVTPDHDVLILWPWASRIDFPSQVQTVLSEWINWQARIIGVEQVAYQRALKQQVLKESLAPVRGLANAKTAKFMRITRRSVLAENGKLWLRAALPDEAGVGYPEIPALGGIRVYAGGPTGEGSDVPAFVAFFDQATQYPKSAHDDYLDAFDNALQVAGGHGWGVAA